LICDQGKIAEYRDDITEAIRDNTKRLDQLGMLVEENRDYMHGLDKRQKNLVTYFSFYDIIFTSLLLSIQIPGVVCKIKGLRSKSRIEVTPVLIMLK
jgi:hypothetical protein